MANIPCMFHDSHRRKKCLFMPSNRMIEGHIVFVLSICLFVCLSVVNFNLRYSPPRWRRGSRLDFGSEDPGSIPAYPHRVWALWWQRGKRRLWTSRCRCRGRLGTLKTPSCPWRGCPAAGQNLETGHLSRHQGWGNRNQVIVIVCNRLHFSK